jgi:hypothetical protein
MLATGPRLQQASRILSVLDQVQSIATASSEALQIEY